MRTECPLTRTKKQEDCISSHYMPKITCSVPPGFAMSPKFKAVSYTIKVVQISCLLTKFYLHRNKKKKKKIRTRSHRGQCDRCQKCYIALDCQLQCILQAR